MRLAAELARGPAVAIGHAKRVLDSSYRGTLAEQLREEAVAGEACSRTEDHREALAAVVEKRVRRFLGR